MNLEITGYRILKMETCLWKNLNDHRDYGGSGPRGVVRMRGLIHHVLNRLTIAIFYTEIFTGKVVLWFFFSSEKFTVQLFLSIYSVEHNFFKVEVTLPK